MADQRLRQLLLLLLLLHCACTYDSQLQQAAVEAASLEDPSVEFYSNCSTDTFAASCTFNSYSYSSDLSILVGILTDMSSSRLFYLHPAATNRNAAIYGMYQCLGYLNQTQCSSCVAAAIQFANYSCPMSINARVALAGCIFLYQNTTIPVDFSELAVIPNGKLNSSSTFLSSRMAALKNVSSGASMTPTSLYSSVVVGDGLVFAVAQCHGYLTISDCHQCLSGAPDCLNSVNLSNQIGGRTFYGSCMYRYEIYRFFTEEDILTAPAPAPSPTTSSINGAAPPRRPLAAGNNRAVKQRLVIGVVVGCCLFLVVALICLIVFQAKCKSPNNSAHEDGATDFLESLHQHQIRMFTSQQMKTATKIFHEDNKLGQGGVGTVYKGILEDGQVVAIKRLTHPSSQGKRQFLSEVETITSVQHRNLIRLLGCCVDGSDRLLVYEYLEQQSLDKHLFDIADAETTLSWSARRKIILGTAKGLAYMHLESHLHIVHRDIKAANILLDNNLDPKIADFGLARLFTSDQTHVSTQIAGTIGYLAPEYAFNGHLTEKSDTYSFGIVILEVLSGRKVIDGRLCPEKQGLLSWTWKLYEGGQQMELVDPFLVQKIDYVVEEAKQMIQVALLCTQSVPELRPTMANVVTFLEDMVQGRQPLGVPAKPALNIFGMSKWVMSSSSDNLMSIYQVSKA